MSQVAIVKVEKEREAGNTGRVASEDTFVTKKLDGSLKPDMNCPSLSVFLLG